MAESTVEYLAISPVQAEAPIRVLHVDDETGFLKAAKQILETKGTLEVDTASSVEEAKRKLSAGTYDVILSDYQMPEKDGLQFLAELREEGNDIPFILFTGKGREELAIKALNLGANYYLNKLGSPETVYGEVRNALKNVAKIRRTERKAREIDEKYRTLIENANQSITIMQKDVIAFANSKTEELTGYSKEELLGKSLAELIHPDDLSGVVERYRKREKGEKLSPFYSFRIITREGKVKWVETNAVVIPWNGTQASLQFTSDITERKKVEEILRESEEKLRSVIESSPDAITVTDLNGIITECNEATLKLFGFSSKDEVIGRNAFEYIVENERTRATGNMKQVLEQGSVKNIQYINLRKDGSRFFAELSVGVIKNSFGKPTSFVGITKDITERKRGEAILSYERDLTNTLLENHPDFIYFKDHEARFKHVSKRFCDFLKRRMEDIIGKTDLELFPEEIAEQTYREDLHIIKTGTSTINKEETAAGMTVLTTKLPWTNEEGEIIGLFGISRDITERKKAEAELEKSAVYLDMMGDALMVLTPDAKLIKVNRAFSEIWGYSPEEILGKFVFELFVEEEKSRHRKEMAIAIKTGTKRVFETIALTKNKRKIPVSIDGIFLKDMNGNPLNFIASFRDITVQKKEEKLRFASESKYRNIVDLSPDGLIVMNSKGFITSINPAFSRLTGFSEEEIIGKHFTKLRTLRAKDIPKYIRLFSSIVRGKNLQPFEFTYIRKDGVQRLGEGRASIMKEQGKNLGVQLILKDTTEHKQIERELKATGSRFEALMEETPVGIVNVDAKGKITYVNKKFTEITGYSKEFILNKSMFKIVPSLGVISDESFKLIGNRMKERLMGKTSEGLRFSMRRKDGKQIWIEAESKAIRKFGVPVALQATLRDITELITSEESLKRTLAKLGTINEKLEVVGGLTRHDVRNKLSTVLSRIYLAKQKLSGNIEAQEDLVEAQKAIKEAERIMNFAKDYESIGKEELAYISVGNNVKSAVSLLPKAGAELEGIKITDECQGVRVNADSMLQQLFYNLIDNSVKHGQDASQIKIYCKTGKNDLKLIYEDNGVGVPKAEKEKIFKKGYGKGTGFGLYLIKKMCEVYGWTIKETGKHGKGAQFTMSIPKLNDHGKVNYRLN